MRRTVRLLAAFGIVALSLLAWATPAAAEVQGSCDAVIKDVSAHDRSSSDPSQAIPVKADEVVPYSVASSTGISSRRFLLDYAGQTIVINSGKNKGESFSSGEAPVKDYAWLGAGLYKVIGQATLKDGTTCSGAVLINVEGNPLTTAIGIGGVVAIVTGIVGLIHTSRTHAGEIIDELVNFVTGPDGPGPVPAEVGAGGDASVTGGAKGPGSDPAVGLAGADDPTAAGGGPLTPVTGDEPPKRGRRGGAGAGVADPGSADPRAGAGSPGAGTTAAGGAPTSPTGAHTGPKGTTPVTADPASPGTGAEAGGAAAGAATGEGGNPAAEPPPLPGMGFVTGTGEKTDALIKAHETLTGAIDELPINDDQKTKLTETLGLEKIKEKLDQVKEVTDTVTHFEGVGTETVDTLNRWGVPPRMVDAVLWIRWTTEASGRATQKFTDAIVTPVLEPVTKAVGEAGIKADATEIAHALLPVQEFAEEASKAAMNSVKNVIGGQQRIDQIQQGCLDEDELAIVRPRW